MMRRVMPTHFLLAALLAMSAFHLLWPVIGVVPAPWNLFGLIPVAAGIWLNLSADGAFHRAGTTVRPYEQSAALMTEGVFRVSRNPMYLGFALLLAGVAILLGSLTPWIVLPLFVLLMERLYIALEERMLKARFGSEWDAYAERVRRWI
jgi:protein-S-isoprenylcysteine O-methyltransferase Ste14